MYLFLFLFWIILNGKITTEIVIFGLVLSAAVYLLLWKFFGYSISAELRIAKMLPKILRYLAVLVVEIIKANICMFRFLTDMQHVNEPALIKFQVPLKSSTLRVALANSITLTPGTITVELTDEAFTVHCYDKSLGEGIES